MVDGDMSISAFSRRSFLSPKALRLYDQMGLLRPNRIVPETGYRYYHESQLEVARLISLLRRLDVPLVEIAEIIGSTTSDASSRLEAWWRHAEEVMEQRRDLLQYIRGSVLGDTDVQSESMEAYGIGLREAPSATYLYVTNNVTGPNLPGYIDRSGSLLIDRAESYGGVVGPMTVVFHGLVDIDSDGPVDVCVPIGGEQVPMDGHAIRNEAAHTQAFVTMAKRQVEFPQILQVYFAMRRWINSEGHEISGSPREIYLADYELAAQHDPICEIAFPIRLNQGVNNV